MQLDDPHERKVLESRLSQATFNCLVHIVKCFRSGTYASLDVKVYIDGFLVLQLAKTRADTMSLGDMLSEAVIQHVPDCPEQCVPRVVKFEVKMQGGASEPVDGGNCDVVVGEMSKGVEAVNITLGTEVLFVIVNTELDRVPFIEGLATGAFADESKHVIRVPAQFADYAKLVARGVVDVAGVGQCAVTCDFVQVLKATLRDAGPLPAADCRTAVSKVLGNTSLADDTTLMPTDWAGEYVSIVAKSKDQVEQLLQSKSGVATHEKECGKYLYVAASSAALTAFLNDPAQRELERKRQAEAKERERLISDAKEKFGPIICECM